MDDQDECRPKVPCELQKEEPREEEREDPRSYCYNLTSKAEHVCKPYVCQIKPKEESVSKDEKSDKMSNKLIPMKKAQNTCVPWKEATPEEKHTLDVEVLSEIALRISDHSEKEAIGLARLVGLGQEEDLIKTEPVEDDIDTKSLASVGAMSVTGALVCECCNCFPCVCGTRGLKLENILAAIKVMMTGGEDMKSLLGSLQPDTMAHIQSLIRREGEKGMKWATGSALTDKPSVELRSILPGKLDEEDTISAMKEAWLAGEFDEMKSCHCLPGMCPCPGGHYIFKKKEEKEVDEKKKKRKRIRKKVKKMTKDGREYEEWDWITPSDSDKESRLSETCICPPTKHFLTPASSESDKSTYPAPSRRTQWADLMICSCPRLQRTLVIIKPEIVKFKDVVLRAIRNCGLSVLREETFQLSPEEASELYYKQYGLPKFPNLIVSISQAPVVVLSVGGVDAVKIWNNIIGPDGVLPSDWFLPSWISREYGRLQEIPAALHASKNIVDADRENRYFFPENIVEPVMKNREDVKSYVEKYVHPTLLKGLAILTKTRPVDPIIFLAEWLLIHNPFQPRFPTNICLTPT